MSIFSWDYLSLDTLFAAIQQHGSADKLKFFLQYSGVEFFDDDFIKSPSVKVCWLWGAWIQIKNNTPYIFWTNTLVSDFFSEAQKMIVYWAFMSYLNSGNKTLDEMLSTLRDKNHKSTEHMVFLNVLVSGISTSVANEFNSQRDLVHLARITEARTKIQENPPYVLLDEGDMPMYRIIKNLIGSLVPKQVHQHSKLDEIEWVNLIHPAAKWTAIILSWSLRNLRKIASMKDDTWKEKEFRRALIKLDDVLRNLF